MLQVCFGALVLGAAGWALLRLLLANSPGALVEVGGSAGLGLALASVVAWGAWATRIGLIGAAALGVTGFAALVAALAVTGKLNRWSPRFERGDLLRAVFVACGGVVAIFVGPLLAQFVSTHHLSALLTEVTGGTPEHHVLVAFGAIVGGSLFIAAAIYIFPILRRSHLQLARWEFVFAILVIGVAAMAAYSGPWLSATADGFYHLAAAKSALRTNSPIPQEVFYTTPVALPDATGGSLTLVLLTLGWLPGGLVGAYAALQVLGAVFETCAIGAFAWSLTSSRAGTLTATALFIGLGDGFDFRSAALPGYIAPALVWLAAAFLARFLEAPAHRRGELVAAGAMAFAAGAVHPNEPLLLAVLLASGFLIYLIANAIRRTRQSVLPFLIGIATTGLAMAPIFVLRLAALPSQGAGGNYSTNPTDLLGRLAVAQLTNVGSWLPVDLAVGGAVLIAMLGRPLRELGRAPGAALIAAAGLALVVLGPMQVAAPTEWAQYTASRVTTQLVPLLLVAWGWGLGDALALLWTNLVLKAMGSLRLETSRRNPPATIEPPTPTAHNDHNQPRARPPKGRRLSLRVANLAFAAVIVTVSAMAFVPALHHARWLYTARSYDSLGYPILASRSGNLAIKWSDRIAAIAHSPSGAVLADLDVGYELAGLTGREPVAVYTSHSPFQDEARDGPVRRSDALRALSPDTPSLTIGSILERYHVADVLLDRALDPPSDWDAIARSPLYEPVASGRDWTLFRYQRERLDGILNVPLIGAVGVAPTRITAGEVFFVRVAGGTTALPIKVLAVTDDGRKPLIGDLIPSSPDTLTRLYAIHTPASNAPDRYRVVLQGLPNPPTPSIVAVGTGFLADSFQGVVTDDYTYADRAGWSGAHLTRAPGGAAITHTQGASAVRPVSFPAGRYCMSAIVFDAGTGQTNRLDVALGAADISLSWSGQSAGLRTVDAPVELRSPPRDLRFAATEIGQTDLVVQSLNLYSLADGEPCSN